MSPQDNKPTQETDLPVKSLSPEAQRARGRHPDYDRISPQEQWEDDKRLGLLDWDGS